MPIYEYECTKCGHEFEIKQSMTEEAKKRCPECRGKVMRVVTGGGGYILKGSGFYATDYRDGSYKKDADKDKPSAKEKPTEKKDKPAKKEKKGGDKKSKS